MTHFHKSLFLFLLTISIVNISLSAQQHSDYDWEAKPILHEIKDNKEAGELVLLEKQVIEYAYDQEDKLTEYVLKHTITKVNSNDAIEKNNRIYLPLKERAKILKQQARVITPAGKVIQLDESDIQEAENENGSKFRYFALKGLEIGSEVEYLVHTSLPVSVDGQIIRLQSDVPKQNVSFDIISPKNLVFAYKGFNGFGEMQQDTSDSELFHLTKNIDFIPAAKPEGQAVYRPNLMQVVFKLDQNLATNSKNLVNYGDIAQNIAAIISQEIDKKTDKTIDKLIKELELDKIKDKEEKVRKLESHIKTNFAVLDISAPELTNLDNIMEYKQASELGIIRLYTNIFKKLDLDYEIVLTSDRNEVKFDEKLEAYPFLQEYLIYLPQLDKYLPPTTPLFCLGLVPPFWTDNFGLFIKPVDIAGFSSGLAEIKYIEPVKYLQSKDDMIIKVKVADRFPNIAVNMEKSVTGYYAQTFQPYYNFVDDETKEELDKAQVQWISEDVEIENVEVLNTDYDNFGTKPLVLKTDYTSKAFVESAGNKFIFKIGELIGPQMEMYQEEERKFPVEQAFQRFYHRVIEFEVPKGYKVSNLDALKFDITHSEDGEKLMAFESDYTLEGNKLEVICDEYYTQNKLPVELFEQYRKVINAAADFNKVVLYLEKSK